MTTIAEIVTLYGETDSGWSRYLNPDGRQGGWVHSSAKISNATIGRDSVISGGVISGGVISGGEISGGEISGSARISGGVISGGVISGSARISGGVISGGEISRAPLTIVSRWTTNICRPGILRCGCEEHGIEKWAEESFRNEQFAENKLTDIERAEYHATILFCIEQYKLRGHQ